jgi:hypothetical protein
MYVSRDQTEAVVLAFSMGSDHWSNVVPRLVLAGLQLDWEYVVSEPMPNNLAQQSGNLMIIETEVPVYQLGYPTVALTGSMLMNAGLPIKFYTLDDSVLFTVKKTPPYCTARGSRAGSYDEYETSGSGLGLGL